MAKAQDIRLTETGDLFINPNTGDFQISESDVRHVEDIIQSYKGDWKEFPLVGVGIRRFSASAGNFQRLTRVIKTQLAADGITADEIAIKDGQIYISGERNNVNL